MEEDPVFDYGSKFSHGFKRPEVSMKEVELWYLIADEALELQTWFAIECTSSIGEIFVTLN